jgi:hypothetical protein
MRRWGIALASLAIALLVVGSTTLLTAQTPVITVHDSRAAVRDRIDAAARLSIASYTDWLGPPPFETLLVGDAMSEVPVSVGLWDSPATMSVESQVAEGIALRWLQRVNGHADWKRGAATYLQTRVVETLFDRVFLTGGHSYDSSCFFGCHATFPHRSLRLSRWPMLSDPAARAFGSLEREVGWPVLQGSLREAAAAGGDDPVGTMSAAIGRDLAPLFAAASSGVVIDHAVANLASDGAGTQVSITSNGPIPFPLRLRVEFEDGQHLDVEWQGRDRVSIESPARAVIARLDPNRVLLLDRNPFNNAIVQPRATNVPIVKWMARWIVWLQDAMLTQTFPV